MDDVHAPRGDGGGVRAVVVLTAAGSGSRLGHAVPKALVPVAGTPLVERALRGLWASGVVDDVVVTVPSEHRADFEAVVRRAVADSTRRGTPASARCVVGGPTRQASVAAGVAALLGAHEVAGHDGAATDGAPRTVVLVHDAARALTPPDVVRRVVEAVASGADVVVPVVPVTDSVVDVSAGVRPVDRTRLRAVQTPQGFEAALLRRAHLAAAHRAADEATAATDDAQLCVALGAAVTLVEGHVDAAKVTTPRDLLVAEALLGGGTGGRAQEGHP
ncbi:2-C-methyl-D-erythritol 4-phosphate cytidylyltransferase [Actinotalea sp. Marseille-Q4924]|uniref:IspD/TarI family cytidylyltransferase n=1 Tax=Actinotalea sp. Marseille-Q4924 TaxID=2866571 RepID=UPI001CE49D11|nr:2-C-methyl-D-erythritol 4-phosphate cytidylyltransferase [Actinotalea sp. Marseille-Q4924]